MILIVFNIFMGRVPGCTGIRGPRSHFNHTKVLKRLSSFVRFPFDRSRERRVHSP